MRINSKKGQAEDIFSDLIISLIIIAITIGAVGVEQIFEKRNAAAKSANELTELYEADILALLRSPMPQYLFENSFAQIQPKWAYQSITYGAMLGIIAGNDKESRPWVFSSAEHPELGTGDYGLVNAGSDKCDDKLRDAIDSRLGFMWQLGIYNEAGSEVFWCSSYKNARFFNERLQGAGMFRGCKIIPIKIPTEKESFATMKWGICQ